MFKKLMCLVSFVLVMGLTNMVSAQILDDFDDGDIGTNTLGIGNGFYNFQSNANVSENAEQSVIHFSDQQSGTWNKRVVNSKDEMVFGEDPIRFTWQISKLSTINGTAEADAQILCMVVTNDLDPSGTHGHPWTINEGGFCR